LFINVNSSPVNSVTVVELARTAIAIEARGMEALVNALDGALGDAVAAVVELIRTCNGRTIVSGMGKSGHIARKFVATLASTGTPAFFVHPAEASHGDLGMIGSQDVVIALSWSGETPELHNLIDYSRRFGVPLVGMTSCETSALGRAADVVLPLPLVPEACPHNLAPTTSTLLQLALCDAISVVLLQVRGFSAADFRNFHPGGKLGANLRLVRDVMHNGPAVPLVKHATPMSEALLVMTGKGFGCIGVTDAAGALCGVVTDGDLRRHMASDLLSLAVDMVMTPLPLTITSEKLASEALAILNNRKVTALFVVDGQGMPVGILHIHDLLRLGIM